MGLSTPVVLLLFNRPHLVERVFREIARAEPEHLFLVADGPRTERERESCEAAREITGLVDWNCRVETDFAIEHQGLPDRIVTGLNRVFDTVDEAIILEDDCLPAPSFFSFCEQLLDRYRTDERIMEIGGCNLQLGRPRTEDSYYFSKYLHTWGWATWRRAWLHFDPAIKSWPAVREQNRFDPIFDSEDEKAYWTSIFDRMHSGTIDTWDFQWQYALWDQRALSIVPSVNLISNIGFGSDSTHTRDTANPYSEMPVGELSSLRHPTDIRPHHEADRFEFEHAYGDAKWRSPLGRFRRTLGKARDALMRFGR